MMARPAIILTTERLILRTWVDDDVQPMSAINQDPQVMEYFPKLQDRATTHNFIIAMNKHFKQHGYTLYACTRRTNYELIGFIGLLVTDFVAHFTPAIEIGWRLASQHWGQGLATEGAQAVLHHGFRYHQIPKIVSFTAANNARSLRVMQKIGLKHNAQKDYFDHPKLAENSPLRRHILYRLTYEQYCRSGLS